MSQIYFYLLFFLTTVRAQETHCVMEKDVCYFSNVYTNSTHLYFYPTFSNVSLVETIEFRIGSNTMLIMTDELCKAFPNLKSMSMYDLKMTTIQPTAFLPCTNLTQVLFYANYISGSLDPGLFNETLELEHISFQNNDMTSIDPRVFAPLENLKYLDLAENFLTHFPIEEFPILPSLERLNIQVNDLTDLDEQELLFKFPNLKKIYMHNNIFNCERVRVILNAFKRKGIEVKDWLKHAFPKNLGLTTVGNVECLTEEERFKRLLEKNQGKGENTGDERNDTVIEHEYDIAHEELEEKVLYLIIGVGILSIVVFLIPLVIFVVWKLQTIEVPDYYTGYSYYHANTRKFSI